MEDNGLSPESKDNSLDQIRALILGQDDKYVQEIVKRNAKEVVGGIVSEALHERESKDGSVNKVLVPLVEKSLHRSIEANSDKIVGTLYPLVGTLVRKAVSSFLVDFVERTNALIENSLSPKSVSWRFKAWQSGIRYSDYVASQVYQYQVQQLFVIHRETGTLLHTISSDPERSKDADLISSMLVAINDFVADAFQSQENEAENELGEIKTGDFTLLIKIGPQAILVAAVVGSVPPDIRSRLQQALEEFHQFYQVPLQEYQGDSAPFAGCETLLNDCLISAKKGEAKGKKKRLIGGVVIGSVLLLLAYLAFLRIDLSILQSTIRDLPPPAGIVLTDTAVKDGKVQVRVLRDPHMQSSLAWLESQEINTSKVTIYEEPFVSLQKNVVIDKVSSLMATTNNALTAIYSENDVLVLSGEMTIDALRAFTRDLRAIPGISQLKPDLTGIDIVDGVRANTEELNTAVINDLVARISSTHLPFAIAQENLDSEQLEVIEQLGQELFQLQLAMNNDKEGLAKAALVEKQKYVAKLSQLEQQQVQLAEIIEKIQVDTGRLNSKLNEAKQKQKSLVSRKQTLETRLKVKSVDNSNKIDDAMMRFEHYEQRIDTLEAQVDAYDLTKDSGSVSSLAAEFDALEADETIENELAALKKKKVA